MRHGPGYKCARSSGGGNFIEKVRLSLLQVGKAYWGLVCIQLSKQDNLTRAT